MDLLGSLVSPPRVKLKMTNKLNLGSWWYQGLIFSGLWVIGHEVRGRSVFVNFLEDLLIIPPFQCGHGALSESTLVCNVIGYVRIRTCLFRLVE